MLALSSNDRGQIGRAVSELTGVQEQLSITMADVGSSLTILTDKTELTAT